MVAGYLYCLYNESYNYYGENVYKLGMCKCFNSRMRGYVTAYLRRSEFKLKSKKIDNYSLGENILFALLKDYRLEKNREFFECELGIIGEAFKKVEHIFSLNKDGREYEIKKIFNKIIKKKVVKQNIIDDKEIKKGIVKSKTIDDQEFDNLLEKQNNGDANKKEIIKIEKKKLMESYGVDTVTPEFVDKFYGKNHVIHNLSSLMDDSNIDKFDERVVQVDKQKQIEKNEIVRDVVKRLGYDSIFDKKKIDRDDFINNMQDVVDNSQLLSRESLKLFNVKKTNSVETVKQFMGFMNRILGEYGLCLKAKDNVRTINKKTTHNYEYILTFTGNFVNFIKKKKPNKN